MIRKWGAAPFLIPSLYLRLEAILTRPKITVGHFVSITGLKHAQTAGAGPSCKSGDVMRRWGGRWHTRAPSFLKPLARAGLWATPTNHSLRMY